MFGEIDPARFAFAFNRGGNVDAIAEDVIAVD
jgi:hypothetical protein